MPITYDTVGQVRYINPEWRDSPEAPRIGTRESRHANTSYREITIRDARTADEAFDLDTSGFELVTQDTTTACRDEERIRSHYRNEMLDLVRDVTGANQTHMLGHLVRTEDQSDFNFAYSRFVHCDFNMANLQDMSLELLERRHVDPDPGWTYAWYNTWQPVENQVQQNALAVLDVRSLAEGDLIDYRYTGYQHGDGDGGLVTAPIYNPNHRWYYYPSMTTSEVLLTKQLDPRIGRACQSPHTSFLDGSVAEDVPPRRSIETRILAVFD